MNKFLFGIVVVLLAGSFSFQCAHQSGAIGNGSRAGASDSVRVVMIEGEKYLEVSVTGFSHAYRLAEERAISDATAKIVKFLEGSSVTVFGKQVVESKVMSDSDGFYAVRVTVRAPIASNLEPERE